MEKVKDIEHYLRLNLLNIEGATPVLQSLVLKIASLTHDKTVEGILKPFKSELGILETNGQRVISKESFDVLFPVDGSSSDVKQWDITLASTVLLNCCTIERKRNDLCRILMREMNGKKNLPAYLKAKECDLNVMKGKQITEKQYTVLSKAKTIDDLGADLIMCLILICGSAQSQNELYGICKTILLQEIEIDYHNKTSVTSYWNTKKEKIQILKRDLTIFDSEFKQLYTDIASYDFNLRNKTILILFVLNLCERLKRKSQVAVKEIRTFRNAMVAHTGKAEIKSEEFLPAWTRLLRAIEKILTEESMDMNEFQNRVKYFKKGNLDIQNAFNIIKEHCTKKSNDYRILKRTFEDMEESITETLEAYQKTMENPLRNMKSIVLELRKVISSFMEKKTLADFKKEMEIKCLDIRIVVKGNDSSLIAKYYQAIEEAITNHTGDDEQKKKKAMDKVLEIIEKDRSTVIELKRDSVIARVKCIHLEGICKLLIYVGSEDWVYDFNALSAEIGQETGQHLAIEAEIMEESLQMLYEDMKHIDDTCEEIPHLSFESMLTNENEVSKEVMKCQLHEKNIVIEKLQKELQTLQDREKLHRIQRQQEFKPLSIKANVEDTDKNDEIKEELQEMTMKSEAIIVEIKKRDKLCVAAIDIGSTSSGYAFSFKHEYKDNPANVSVNQNWIAGFVRLMSLKTPTCALFDENNRFHSFGYEAENTYVELAFDGTHENWHFFKRFKIKMLMDQTEITVKDDKGQALPATVVYSGVIKYLKGHLLETLAKRGNTVNNKDIHWVLTVPAVWTDSQKLLIWEAAFKAGIDKDQMSIALEPEAASLFGQALSDGTHGSEVAKFQVSSPGSRYMIMDLGGDVAYITVHERQADGRLKELNKSIAEPCGGNRVDEAFYQLLIDILGALFFKQFCDNYKNDHLDLQRAFEMKKHTVTPASTGNILLRVPVSISKTYKEETGETVHEAVEHSPFNKKIEWIGDKVKIDADIFKGLFQASCEKIVNILKELLQDPEVEGTNIVLMVGGFSESAIVQDAIIKALPDCKIIIPHGAGLSVLKGAVIFGHRPVPMT